MKSFFLGHWEKCVAAAGLLLLGASLAMNLLLTGPPPVVADADRLMGELRDLENKAVAEVPSVPPASRDLAALLERHPGTFEVPSGLLNYGASAIDETKRLVVDEVWDPVIKTPFETLEISGDAAAADVEKIDETHIRVTARKAGSLTISMGLGGKNLGALKVQVRAKNRIELWPPVLKKAAPNPAEPGEIALSWADHPRTAPEKTLGYVVERRSPPGKGEFLPIPALEGGRMFPPAVKAWVDVVEPNRRYEYRVLAIGDPAITHVLDEAGR